MKKSLCLCSIFLFANLALYAEDETTKQEKAEVIKDMVKSHVQTKVGSKTLHLNDKTSTAMKIANRLENPIHVDWEEESLKEAISELRSLIGINIVVHNKVDLEKSVSLKFKNVKAKNVLKFLLKFNGLSANIQDEVLFIAAPKHLPLKDLTLKIYDINDLITKPKNYPAELDIGNLAGMK